MSRRPVVVWAVLLAGIGLGLFFYKVVGLGFPLRPAQREALWDLELRLRFRADGGPVKAALAIPETGGRYAIVDENFISPGYGLTTEDTGTGRRAVWAIRWAGGEQVFYYRAVVQRLAGRSEGRVLPVEPVRVDLQDSQFAAAYALLYEVVQRSADLPTLVAQLVERLHDDSDPNVALLVGPRAGQARRLWVASMLLGLRETPARVVRGVRLEARRRSASLIEWLEVWNGDEWLAFDPTTGQRERREDALALVRGGTDLATVEGGGPETLGVAVRRSEQSSLRAAVTRGTLINPDLIRFSLAGLPIRIQEVYRVLLMIPVGAFLLVLLRGFVGIKTFGTFMPVLIALAFRETELLWGVVLFLIIVSLGLAVRFYLERLKLLMVPRVAAVLIIVVFLMLCLSILSHRLNIDRGLSVALFPMVILTMTIERMSVAWEERGGAEAIEQGVGSLLVAVFAYLVMSNHWVEHWFFIFPELLLVLLAGSLLMGCYTGYRLLEYWRFRDLIEGEG
ncbi:MAG: inactive transglutaminase family protein [Thermoanaerobaculia bacterium]